MVTLAIDTSTQWCSVALDHPLGGGQTPPFLFSKHEDLGPGASAVVLNWVAALIDEAGITLADLERIAVGIGPGAFTGIRIGVGVAQGLALARNLPCVGIPCLDAVALEGIRALQLLPNEPVLVAMDARMNEVYWAQYVVNEHGFLNRLGDILLSSPQAVSMTTHQFHLMGNAVVAYPQEMADLRARAASVNETVLPHARSISSLANTGLYPLVAAADLQPIYIRDKVAQTIAERSAGAL